MTLAALLFAWLVATIYGAGFHVIAGGGAGRLLLYLSASWLGFAIGHLIGELGGFDIWRVGQVNVLPATLGAVVALGLAWKLAPRPKQAK